MKKIFKHQIWHLLSIVAFIFLIRRTVSSNPVLSSGSFLNIGTGVWFWIAFCIPILHQIYVWLIWRLELYQKTFTSRFGMPKAFVLYKTGFSILFLGRLLSISILALSNLNTYRLAPIASILLVSAIAGISVYVIYSVAKFFTIDRAYGIDHFDKDYGEPFERRGIFRYTNNAMYIYGLLFLYLPGLIFHSLGALLLAAFNHIFIWAHYFFTERPDMLEIYGAAPSRQNE